MQLCMYMYVLANFAYFCNDLHYCRGMSNVKFTLLTLTSD